MSNKKKIRTRGKILFSRYFQILNKGDNVSVIREPAVQPSFPKQIQGRTGYIEKKQGKAYIVKIKDGNKLKSYIIEPIHLKKIKN